MNNSTEQKELLSADDLSKIAKWEADARERFAKEVPVVKAELSLSAALTVFSAAINFWEAEKPQQDYTTDTDMIDLEKALFCEYQVSSLFKQIKELDIPKSLLDLKLPSSEKPLSEEQLEQLKRENHHKANLAMNIEDLMSKGEVGDSVEPPVFEQLD